jgi:glycosyltransferase involved in cell wall biosynthesis
VRVIAKCYAAVPRAISTIMLTAIIPTHNSERALVPTLAMLVPGAMTGTVREVIVIDGGSTDATAQVVDIAGCELMTSSAPLGTRLKAAAAAARGTWLLFLRPGVVLDAAWVEEAARVIENAVARGTVASHAAVFRRSAAPDAKNSFFRQVLDLLMAALRGPHPDQGLMLSRQFYDRIGGHRAYAPDPETELLRRIGRRRLVTLRSGAIGWRGQDS